jgi:hypothetical protein
VIETLEETVQFALSVTVTEYVPAVNLFVVDVESLFDHLNLNGDVPPETTGVAEPLFPLKQDILFFDIELIAKLLQPGVEQEN